MHQGFALQCFHLFKICKSSRTVYVASFLGEGTNNRVRANIVWLQHAYGCVVLASLWMPCECIYSYLTPSVFLHIKYTCTNTCDVSQYANTKTLITSNLLQCYTILTLNLQSFHTNLTTPLHVIPHYYLLVKSHIPLWTHTDTAMHLAFHSSFITTSCEQS